MSAHGRTAGAGRSAAEFLRRLFREFNRDGCLTRASGLAFASLLALVPLSALLFSLFSAIGPFSDMVRRVQEFLIHQLVPTSQEEIMNYVNRFVDNTRALGVVGLLFFLITSVFLLNTIQNNFDAVWRGGSQKLSLRRLATYVSVLIVGSFLVSIGLNVTGLIQALIGGSAARELGRTFAFLLEISPSIFVFLVLLLMIEFVPTGRVRLLSALIGAASGAVLWEVARRIFYLWVNYVIRLSVMYGSLAIIPIFLIWLYVAWAIVLFALEIAHVHQHGRHGWIARDPGQMTPAERLAAGLEAFLFIAGRFYRGESPPTVAQVAEHLGTSTVGAESLTRQLHRDGLIIPAARQALVPSRSLDSIVLADVVASLFGRSGPQASAAGPAPELLQAVIASALGPVRSITVMSYLRSSALGPAEPDRGEQPPHPRGRRMLAAAGGMVRRLLGKGRK